MDISTTMLEALTAAPIGPQGLRVFRWQALGTQCELQFVCDEAVLATTFQRAAVEWVEDFEARYSRFRANSLLSQINHAAGRAWVEIDAEMEKMLDLCAAVYGMSGGILDSTALPLLRLWNYRSAHPRLPTEGEILAARQLVGWPKVQRAKGRVFLPREGMALDFGGWGKEYAVDAVVHLARSFGIAHLLVDFGHDLRAIGTPPGRPGWHIGLEDPARPGSHRGSIGIIERGVASSGDYQRHMVIGGRRYGHIVDPRTGWPVSNGCLQATVIAPSCLQAGALSTTAFVLGGEKGIPFIQQVMGAEGLILTETARHQTRSFFQYVVHS